jgi:hypothetical protein
MENNLNAASTSESKFSSTDLATFAEAIKESGRNLKQASWEYPLFGEIERKALVRKVDAFIAAVTRSWSLMREEILKTKD